MAAAANAPAADKNSRKSYQNILVLAIADNYEGRAQYERAVASGLRKEGISATAYHSAVGGSGDVSRERSQELIAEYGFDAVLVTQVRRSDSYVDVAQDGTGEKVSRREDSPVDFFRYSYEELNEPGEISVLAEAILDTNLHDAADETVTWTFTWSSKGSDNVGILIDKAAKDTIKKMQREKLLKK
jgi:hypothetical protein